MNAITLRYGTMCSGIEGFSVAVHDLPYEAKWFAEIEPFRSRLLKFHYPRVQNHGDITKINPKSLEAVDVIVCGSPCQSFSVQGLRGGLDDPRGKLALRFVDLAAALRPDWLVWENVTGVLSSGGGKDFGQLASALAECGYLVAHRVLDAGWFGVPQHRSRVYVVGHRRRLECAAGVLFDGLPDSTAAGSRAKAQGGERSALSLVGHRFGLTGDITPKYGVERCPTVRASQGGEGICISQGNHLRKLTVTEYERLFGLPDGYTAIPAASDAQRRRAIGDGFAVPVLRWIAQRIFWMHTLEEALAGPISEILPCDPAESSEPRNQRAKR